jgi:membrane-bound metal-dependent hydrolase YbcI (DUF457 family)
VPFTPFHFGPGLLLKGVAPKHVSMTAFAITQVAIDLEPLYYILRQDRHAHRAVHTVWVAGAVGLGVGLLVWAIGRRWAVKRGSVLGADVQPAPALIGGLIGGISHPILDGLQHQDIYPLRPLADTQFLLDPGGTASYVGCAIAGVLGVALLTLRAVKR